MAKDTTTNTTPSTGNTTATTQNAWAKKEIGALWTKTKKGSEERFLTGVLNLKALGFDKDVPVVIFSNKNKNKDSQPDLRVYISEKNGPAAPVTNNSIPQATPTPATRIPNQPGAPVAATANPADMI